METAAEYLGLTESNLAGVVGIVCSAVGTGRALAFNSAIKQIPSPNGQGIRIQPKYRMGAECWDALSVVPIVKSDFAVPGIDTTSETKKKDTALYVRGKSSRTARS